MNLIRQKCCLTIGDITEKTEGSRARQKEYIGGRACLASGNRF